MKWLKPYCQPTMAHTMKRPAQLRNTITRRVMILACDEAGVLGEKESYTGEGGRGERTGRKEWSSITN